MLNNGNVGIGTTNPGSLLQVSTTNQSFSTANGNAVNIAFQGGGAAGDIGGGLVFSQKYLNSANAIIRTGGIYGLKNASNGSFGGGLVFYTQPFGAADMNQSMILDDQGRLQLNQYTGSLKTGTPTFLLGTDASGNVVKTNTVPGSGAGPYLPLSAGSGFPLTGDLYINKSAPALRLNDSGSNVPYELRVDGTTFSIKEVTNSRTLMSMTAGAVITLDSLGSNTVINTSGAMVVPNGSVGIGTTGPTASLEVKTDNATIYDSTSDSSQDNGTATILVSNDNVTTNTFSQIAFHNKGSNRGISRIVSIGVGNASTDLAFVTENNNTKSEKMRILANGNVGIGTTLPTYKFEVSNGTITGTFNPNSSGFMFLGSTSNHPLYFGVNDSTKMVILSSGNVGIGTTSPSEKLEVVGNILTNGSVALGRR